MFHPPSFCINTYTLIHCRFFVTLSQSESSVKTDASPHSTQSKLIMIYSTEMYCIQIVFASGKEQKVFSIMAFSFFWNVILSIFTISHEAFGLQANIPQRAPG